MESELEAPFAPNGGTEELRNHAVTTKSSGMARSLLLLYYNLVLLISLRTVLCCASLFSCSSPGLAVAELTVSSRRYLARSLSFAWPGVTCG